MPVGEFGDDSGYEAGLANTGFGFGLAYRVPLGVPSLSLVFDAGLLANPLDTDPIEFSMGGGGVDATSWWNIPVLSGIRFDAPASPLVSMYGTGLVGVSFARSPEITWSGMYYDGMTWYNAKIIQKSGSGTSFGLKLGGGLLIADRLDVGVSYLNLGKPEFDVDTQLMFDGYSAVDGLKFKQSVSMLLISAGVRF
jgi:hypothetical protein